MQGWGSLSGDERLGFGSAHTAFEQGEWSGAEVGDKKRVQDVREFRIEIESEEPAACLEILAQQYWDALGIVLDVRDRKGDVFDVGGQ